MPKFDRNGWVYKITYGWRWHQRPNQASLCSLFWGFVASLFVVWPLFYTMAIVVVAFVVALKLVGTPIAPLFGYRPIYHWEESGAEGAFFKRIEKWPTWKGHRILPGVIIFLLGGITVASLMLWEGLGPEGLIWFSIATGITLGVILAIVMLLLAVLYFFSSEGWMLTKEFFRAKKQKFCPMVTFE